MCEWTDKYPVGSEHWLFGEVVATDPGDEQPLCFVKGDAWVADYVLEKVEDKGHVLEKLIDSLGVDVVLKALEKRIGVPESVHWKTLKVGDTVEVVDNPHRDDVGWISRNPGPYEVICLESDDYEGTMTVRVLSLTTGDQHWPEISSIKGVHGDS